MALFPFLKSVTIPGARVLLCLWCMMLLCDVGTAQPLFFGNDRARVSTAVMAGYSIVNFEFNGENKPSRVLDFTEPAYGLTYSRSNLAASIFWGRQNAADTTSFDLSLIDFNLAFWGEVFFSEAATSAPHQFFVPITVFSNFRKVAPRNLDILEEFSITTLGLGLGIGYYGSWGENTLFEMRSTPSIGYAARSFGDSAGTARLIDTDAQLHLEEIFGKLGLSIGYHLRIMVWDVSSSNVFNTFTDDLFKYRDQKHTIQIGLNW